MNIKNKIKDKKGVTIIDVVIGLIILMLFTGILTTTVYQIYRHNYITKQDAIVTNYMVKIAEYIDLIPYDDVDENLSSTINNELSIPSAYVVSLEIEDYAESQQQKDIIKYVTISISYEGIDKNSVYTIKKLKIKEI